MLRASLFIPTADADTCKSISEVCGTNEEEDKGANWCVIVSTDDMRKGDEGERKGHIMYTNALLIYTRLQ